jgi:hypothetical protein
MIRGTLSAPYNATSTQEQYMPRKREIIEPKEGDKRYVRRDENGRFEEVEDIGRSLSQDRQREAQTESEQGQGDRGDRSE